MPARARWQRLQALLAPAAAASLVVVRLTHAARTASTANPCPRAPAGETSRRPPAQGAAIAAPGQEPRRAPAARCERAKVSSPTQSVWRQRQQQRRARQCQPRRPRLENAPPPWTPPRLPALHAHGSLRCPTWESPLVPAGRVVQPRGRRPPTLALPRQLAAGCLPGGAAWRSPPRPQRPNGPDKLVACRGGGGRSLALVLAACEGSCDARAAESRSNCTTLPRSGLQACSRTAPGRRGQ